MTELKITKGDFEYFGGAVWIDTRHQVCCGKPGEECCGNPDVAGDVEMFLEASEGDGTVIASALNVAKQTGLTPSQLLEQRDELLSSARWLWDFAAGLMEDASRLDDSSQFQKVRNAIAKAESCNV